MNPSLIFFLFVSLVLSQPVHAEKAEPALYNPVVAQSDNNDNEFFDNEAPVHTITLPDIEVNIPFSNEGPRQTGVVYQLPEPVTNSQLVWKELTGGYVTRIQLFADQARQLRFHLRFVDRLSSIDIQLRVQGDLDIAPLGPIDQSSIHSGELWLPITRGDSAELEIFIKSSNYPDSLIFVLDAINYIVVDNTHSSVIPYSLGLAREKQSDLACWSGNAEYTALKQVADATAKIRYISDDASYICSGTLLTDSDYSYTLWFATAHHCIPDQVTANTAEFEWFFQAASCGSNRTDSRYEITFGGGQLLWTDYESDISFLKLYQKPRGQVVFAGWDTNIKVGDLVWGVHHPKGDHVMVSNGHVTDLLQYLPSARLIDVIRFVNGSTEKGSSGSGLFSIDGNNSYWKGALYGGTPSDNQISYYGHFNHYFDRISGWLRNTAPIPPTLDQISCVFDKYMNDYALITTKESNYQQYIYRYNDYSDFYLGVSYADNHLYYMHGYEGRIYDLGPLSDWHKKYCEGTLIWKIKDLYNDQRQVNYKFYDRDNDWVWPSADQYYYTENYNIEHTHVLSCKLSAKICIGGRTGSSFTDYTYWGVDIDDSKECEDCCSFCNGSTINYNFGE